MKNVCLMKLIVVYRDWIENDIVNQLKDIREQKKDGKK